ncbi:MAG: hypothetical protein HC836_33065 [Richelia sp. RM2_1_2]|nr:hypothetical protein [Richelia sp. RM2_1_2]
MRTKIKKIKDLPHFDEFLNTVSNNDSKPYQTSASSHYPTWIYTTDNTSGPAIYPTGGGTTAIPSGGSVHHNKGVGTLTEPTHITITDEDGKLLKLSIAEVSRYYAEAHEYRRIKRFARIFPMIREILNELLISIKLSDPLDDDELNRLEKEAKKSKSR